MLSISEACFGLSNVRNPIEGASALSMGEFPSDVEHGPQLLDRSTVEATQDAHAQNGLDANGPDRVVDPSFRHADLAGELAERE